MKTTEFYITVNDEKSLLIDLVSDDFHYKKNDIINVVGFYFEHDLMYLSIKEKTGKIGEFGFKTWMKEKTVDNLIVQMARVINLEGFHLLNGKNKERFVHVVRPNTSLC